MSKIVVRKEHIENAVKKDSHHCMIADAIKDKFGAQYIIVDTQSIRFSDPESKQRLVFLTPPVAQENILRWDRGIQVQPFAFNLGSPVKVMPMNTQFKGTPEQRKKARKKENAKRKAQRAARKNIDPMAPRLVKRLQPKVTRHREFGIRRWTTEK